MLHSTKTRVEHIWNLKIDNIHKWENAVVSVLNILGWELTWSGEGYKPYDAYGYTPKGFPCVIEMKFRQKYYENKMLEKKKYDTPMALPKDVVKIYFVADPQGNYFFWLNKLDLTDHTDAIDCPKNTLWNGKKIKKDVYLIPELRASQITKYDEDIY